MENYNLQYIEPSDTQIKDIRELIKKQGDKTCKNEVSLNFSEKVSNFTFGWIYILPKAQLGRRSIKNVNDKFTLLGFILCNYSPFLPHEMFIEIVCSVNKSGKLLMELAEEKARTMNIKKIELYSLPNTKLKNWYESLGYVHIRTIDLMTDVPKVFVMVKLI